MEGWSRDVTFEERYELDKPFIARFAFPWLYYDRIFWVSSHVFGVRVKLDACIASGERSIRNRTLFAYYDNAIEWPVEIR
jgi:hypothetical protein